MSSNDNAGIAFAQPLDLKGRKEIAKQCSTTLEISMPMVVDDIDDKVGNLYSGMPDRLYVVDANGKVAYKGGRGPFGFKTGEMEQSLILALAEYKKWAKPTRVPVVSNEEAWRKLPKAERGQNKPLPNWARALVSTLPRTTAALLELDYLQRTHSSLDPKLRAKIRFVVAHSNRCPYSQQYALADLRRAGGTDRDLRAFEDPNLLSDLELEALSTAKTLTEKAYSLTDEQMEDCRKELGNERLVALVLEVAYYNFLDRMVLTLGVPVEEGGPLPPLDVKFANLQEPMEKIEREQIAETEIAKEGLAESGWSGFDFTDLQSNLKKQKARTSRIPVPTWDDVKAKMTPEQAKIRRPTRIKWSLVCAGYQPQLAVGWNKCMGLFGDEANQDRVFEESLFWVITRELQCFY